jgi:guanylate kinase
MKDLELLVLKLENKRTRFKFCKIMALPPDMEDLRDRLKSDKGKRDEFLKIRKKNAREGDI